MTKVDPMFKIKFIAKRFAVSLYLVCLLTTLSWSNVIDSENFTTITKDQLKERIEQLPSEIDLRYTSEVHSIIDTYIDRYRRGSEVLLGRVERYFPIYEQELNRTGIPNELKYISVVESALRPTVVSHAGAVGLWQFMKGTGRLYGLRINSAVDERRDPLRSTEAATAYLKDLYHEFGDWTLAIAAYNCGPGNVRRAISRSNGEKFWEIKNYLPRETRRYVPKYVAISYVMNYFQAHGLEPLTDNAQEKLATAKLYHYASFKDISNKSGVDYRTVRDLNPAYLKGYIPTSSQGYYLTLPEDDMYSFLSAYDHEYNIVETPNVSSDLKYKLALYTSMRRTAKELNAINRLPSILHDLKDSENKAVHLEGLNLPVPKKASVVHSIDRIDIDYKFHSIKPQQSLQDVAELYATRLDDLMEWNDLSVNKLPPPGTLVKIKIKQ